MDPCAIIIVGNWTKHQEQQVEQQFFCHHDCFKAAIAKVAELELEMQLEDKPPPPEH